MLVSLLYSVFLAGSTLAQNPAQLPVVTGESLSGSKVELPAAASGRVGVLIFGFSRASKTH